MMFQFNTIQISFKKQIKRSKKILGITKQEQERVSQSVCYKPRQRSDSGPLVKGTPPPPSGTFRDSTKKKGDFGSIFIRFV